MFSATDNVSHPFIRIVHNNGEVEDGFVKGTRDDKIAKVGNVRCYLAANNISERDCSARIPETNNLFPVARVFRYLF